MAAKTATPATAVAAGVKTPGSGAYADPMQVGTMIQKMYPQYANMDTATLGQRWIDVHTPQASTTGGGNTDVLQAPGTTPMTSTNPNQNMPDLSGLSQFASPVQQQQNTGQQAPLVGSGGQGGGAALSAPKLAPTPAPSPTQPVAFKPLPKGLSINL